jgi:hypothetical protein
MSSKYTFQAKSIALLIMLADVTVEVHDLPEIEVEAFGDEYICSHLESRMHAASLTVGFPIPLLRGGYAMSGNTNRQDGILTIDNWSIDESRKIKVVVRIPQGTPLALLNVLGDSVVGNTLGLLETQGSMGFKLDAGDVRQFELQSSSWFITNVASVTGSLKIQSSSHAKTIIGQIAGEKAEMQISSHATVEIKRGICLNLEVSASSHATAELGCTAGEARLRGSSHAIINLAKCEGVPSISHSSGARITVG